MDQLTRRIPSVISKEITSKDNTKIYYEVSGKGKKALVFVHGLGGDVAAWDEIRTYFITKGYKTIALDLRAHGMSGTPRSRDDFSFTSFAEDIDAVITAEQLDSLVLVGHCFGGMVVTVYEMQYPNKASALVIINSGSRAPYLSPTSPLMKLLKPLVRVLSIISPGRRIQWHVDYTRKGFERDFEPVGFLKVLKNNSLRTFLSATDTILSVNMKKKLTEISTKTLIISGTRDTVYPERMSEELHTLIPGSEYQVIDGANHPVVLNNPMEISITIARYLKHANVYV